MKSYSEIKCYIERKTLRNADVVVVEGILQKHSSDDIGNLLLCFSVLNFYVACYLPLQEKKNVLTGMMDRLALGSSG